MADNDNPGIQDYPNVPDVPLISPTTDRVLPRQVSTGLTRGDQTIRGRILVMDSAGVVRMVIGYQKDGF